MRNTLLLLVSMLNGFGATVQGPNNDRNLFDSFNGAPVDKPPFPFVYKDIETKSDVVIVRCPGNNFMYDAPEKVLYKLYGEAMDQKISGLGANEDKVVWKAVVNKETDGTKVIYPCGELRFVEGGISGIKKWDIQLEWKDPPKPLKKATLLTIDIMTIDAFSDCNDSTEVVKIIKKRNGELLEYTHRQTKIFKNEFIYIFLKEKITEKKENFLVPCVILNPRLKIPDIIVADNSDMRKEKIQEVVVHLFKKDIAVEGIKIEFKVANGTTDFYGDFFMHGSITAISKKLNIEGKLEDNGKLNVNEKNEVTFDGFQIFEVSFECPDCLGTEKVVNKVFFNGLNAIRPRESLETISYLLGNFTQTPRCPILFKTYGIISGVTFDNDTAKYEDLKNGVEKNNFKVVGEEINYKKKDPVGTLVCSYKIPGGSVSTSQDFKGHPRGKILYKDGIAYYPDTPGYSMLQAEIDRKKKIQEEKEAAKRRQEERRMRIIVISSSVGGISIIIAMVGIVIFIILNKRRIMSKINSKGLSKTYPLVYKFWNFLQQVPFKEIYNLLDEKKYAPIQPVKKEPKKSMEKNGIKEGLDLSIYDSTLVKSKDPKIKYNFRAHAITSKYQKRKYILAENPTLDNHGTFWDMIYNEEVNAIVALIYQTDNDEAVKYNPYWPEDTKQYGDMTVKNLGLIECNLTLVKVFNLELQKAGKTRSINFYFVNEWKNGDIPESLCEIIDLHNSVSKHAGDGSVLIHSSSQLSSGTFVIMFFAASVETLLTGTDVSDETQWNVMMIIKRIREQVYGGVLSRLEFTYLIVGIIEYFVTKKIILEDESFLNFNRSYQDYIRKIRLLESSLTSPIKSFLIFINSLDKGKVEALSVAFESLRPKEYDGSKCKIYEAIKVSQLAMEEKDKNSNLAKQKSMGEFFVETMREQKYTIRDCNNPCLDFYAVQGYDSTPSDDKLKNFMHANEFCYKLSKFERKMILCQAPLENRNNRMLDMIYREKVKAVVILCRDSELLTVQWQRYYMERKGEKATYGIYSIVCLEDLMVRDCVTRVGKFKIVKDKDPNDLGHEFYIIHFPEWQKDGIITDVNQFVNLYKTIDSIAKKDKIIIHCINGTGRTGTLALFMYLIDTLEAGKTFNMKGSLACLRMFRLNAVELPIQFQAVLLALLYYYKNDVMKIDESIFEKAEEIIKNEIKSQFDEMYSSHIEI